MIAQQLAVLPSTTRQAIAEKEVTLVEALRQKRRAERAPTFATQADRTVDRFGIETQQALAAADEHIRQAEQDLRGRLFRRNVVESVLARNPAKPWDATYQPREHVFDGEVM